MLDAVVDPDVLRELRTQRAMSQDDLALRAGLGRQTVIRAEQGKPIRISSLRRLADALHVSPRRLLLRAR